jgi:hypothetical protein
MSLAVTGIKAAAAAWAADPGERKKALFAYLLEALPFLVWDNIPRGTMIACPHLERASTAETYSDRVLGETKTLSRLYNPRIHRKQHRPEIRPGLPLPRSSPLDG